MATINGSNSGETIDEITGGGSTTGNDVINANGGDDTIVLHRNDPSSVTPVQAITDVVHGGDGSDTLQMDLWNPGGFAIGSGTLAAGYTGSYSETGTQTAGGAGTYTVNFDGIERFNLTLHTAATVTTGDGADILTSTAVSGATLNAGGGNDTININVGTVDGGAGSDTLVIDQSAEVNSVYLVNSTLSGSLASGYSGTYRADYVGDVVFSNIENFNVNGGSANDTLIAGDGNDVLSGGAGNDTITIGKGNDIADGGDGTDTLNADFSDEAVGVTVDLNAAAGTAEQLSGTGSIKNFENFGTITGSGFADTFKENGTGGDSTYNTGAGNDIVQVMAGNDVINMGTGTDTLILNYASEVNTVHVQTAYTADSNGGYDGEVRADYVGDALFTSVENFQIYTGTANDTLFAGDGNDILSGGAGNDTIVAGKGANTIDGGADNDYLSIDLSGQTTGVTIDLTKTGEQDSGGTNSIKNIETFDGAVTGTAFNDTMIESNNSGNATFSMGAGNDLVKVISTSNGTQTVDGGTGTDTLVIDSSTDNNTFHSVTDPTGSLAAGYSGQYRSDYNGDVVYSNIENFQISTGASNDTITTGDGDDIVNAAAGNDVITVGKGTNVVDGGDGNDYLSIDLSGQSVGSTIDLTKTGQQASGGTNSIQNVETFNGTVNGSAYNDTLIEANNSGSATFTMGGGDDLVKVISTSNGTQTVDGGTGTDTLVIDSSTDPNYFHTLSFSGNLTDGYAGAYRSDYNGDVNFSNIENFQISSGGTGDTIQVGDGTNSISSGAGNDTLTVGSGANTIDAGDGIDYLSIDLSKQTSGVTIDLTKTGEQDTGGTNSIRNVETFNGTVNGTAYDDTLIDATNYGAATFSMGAGDDTVKIISVSSGSQTVDGGDGNDTLIIDSSADGNYVHTISFGGSLAGGYTGALRSDYFGDVNFSNVENFQITSGASGDTIQVGDGNDIVNSGAGDDSITVGQGTNIVDGGDGTDTLSIDLSGQSKASTIDLTKTGQEASGGTNSITNVERFGGTVTGSAFGDTLIEKSTGGNATFNMGVGNDFVEVAGGNDTVNGGAGTDTLVIDVSGQGNYFHTNGLSGDLTNGYSGDYRTDYIGDVNFTGIENFDLYGGASSDNLTTGDGTDILSGGAGNDTLSGAGGDDLILGGSGDDVLDGGAGNDTASYADATGAVTVDLTLQGAGQATGWGTDTLTNFENLTGSAYADTLTGDANANVLNGGAGADKMSGGAGDDTYYVDSAGDNVVETATGGNDTVYSSVSYNLAGRYVETLTLTGTANINATGNGQTNRLNGNSGNNVLDGGAGADTMAGGAGDDTYYVDSSSDNVIELAGGGNDTVYASASYNLTGRQVETLILTGMANINATGNSLDQTFQGNSGNNVIDGVSGNDTVTYANATAGVTANLATGTATGFGTDTLANIDNVIGSSFDDVLTGNSGVNALTGGAGNDVLDGGAGADVMTGGAGNDTFYVDNSGDKVIEANNGGTDSVFSSVSYSLGGQYVENLTLTGTGNINATGNSLANQLTGNSGNNVLDGGTGADTMTGGDGNDTYYVDSSADNVVEGITGGNDTVYSSATYTLAGRYVETLILTGAANVSATGNGQANLIEGNAGNNTLDGGAGVDTVSFVNATGAVNANLATGTATGFGTDTLANFENLTGSNFNDVLTGDANANVIDGGVGADTMAGGAGNDTYYVGNSADNVVELAGGGNDTVYSTATYSLAGRDVETLILTGTANINATGGATSNTIEGNAGNNALDGGAGIDTVSYANATGAVTANLATGTATGFGTDTLANFENMTGSAYADRLTGDANNNVIDGGVGADVMTGGLGDDTYYVDNASDNVVEANNGGNDTVYSSVSYGLAGRYVETLALTGTAAIDATGNSLANTLIGNSGNNVLDGGAGSDTLTGGAGKDHFLFDTALGASNVDTITDFTVGGDLIQLDRSIFSAAGVDGTLSAAAFTTGTAATTASQRIIYNSATGDIYYDADGNGAGAAVKFAHVNAGLALTASSFVVSG